MAFAPSSTIYLCSVPFDSSYKNQVYFTTRAKQLTYFRDRVKKTFSDYLTVRKTMPDGSLRSSVKVDANIDSLYGYNYMFYQNQNHGARYFYCFIIDLIYINEGTTEIVFETDVYQTWRFDVDVLESFVVREHSVNDVRGENVVPEKFNYDEYVYCTMNPEGLATALKQWGYLIVCSEPATIEGSAGLPDTVMDWGVKMSGVYQGLHFYYYTNPISINAFLKALNEDGLEGVLAIVCIPEFNLSAGNVGLTDEEKADRIGLVRGTDYPAEKHIYVKEPSKQFLFQKKNGEAYNPKNNKLFTSQFYRLVCTNHTGQRVQYSVEDLDKKPYTNSDGDEATDFMFSMYGDVSPSPTVAIYPRGYKGYDVAYDYCVTLGEFPQCSFLSDSYKLWLARNRYTLWQQLGSGVASFAGGAGVSIMTGSLTGFNLAAQGAHKIIDVMVECKKAQMIPNIANVGQQVNNLLTGMGENTFRFEYEMLKGEYAEKVDDYFTMYGYATHEVKIPNFSSRPYFNYVETVDVNITDNNFGIPNRDMEILKNMYNNGVTLWKPEATIGDYSVDNSPT